MPPSIFIQIAAYRDLELLTTIQSAIESAKYSERLCFGVCWQFMPGLDEYLLFPDEIAACVKLVAIPADKSKGVCWARFIAQSLYTNEDYVLSIDSHCRFVKDWDVKIIEELASCPSVNPVLTTYPAPFKAQTSLDKEPIVRLQLGEICDGSVRFKPKFVEQEPNSMNQPAPSLLCACGFYFARGNINNDIPIDPIFYFNQEEFVHSLKLWTHGYECFIPTQHFVVHQYGKEKSIFDKAVHWDDDPKWVDLNRRAQVRLKSLLESSYDPASGGFPISKFPLGEKRPFEEFLTLLGLKYKSGALTLANHNSVSNKEHV